jgi:beta-glucosidase
MYLPRIAGIPGRAGARRLGGNVRTLTVAVALLSVAALVVATPPAKADPRTTATPLYLDPSAATSARVEDLLHRMTLAEKIGQMDQIVVGRLRDTTNPADGNCNNRSAANHVPSDVRYNP